MPRKKDSVPKKETKKPPQEVKPAMDPESREKQLINHAINLAEKQMMEGTASATVITHFLKLATTRERLERDILEKQSELIEAKANNIKRDVEAENLAKAAIDALKSYNPG